MVKNVRDYVSCFGGLFYWWYLNDDFYVFVVGVDLFLVVEFIGDFIVDIGYYECGEFN